MVDFYGNDFFGCASKNHFQFLMFHSHAPNCHTNKSIARTYRKLYKHYCFCHFRSNLKYATNFAWCTNLPAYFIRKTEWHQEIESIDSNVFHEILFAKVSQRGKISAIAIF